MNLTLDENVHLHVNLMNIKKNIFFLVIAVLLGMVGYKTANEYSMFEFLQLYGQSFVLMSAILLTDYFFSYFKYLEIKSRLWDNYKKPVFLGFVLILISVFNALFQQL